MKILAFDIETASAEELPSYGPGFVKLCGWKDVDGGPVHVTEDPAELVHHLTAADGITGHNILNFDLLALAKYHGADYEALAVKSFDTLLVERHITPVAAKGVQANGFYTLDQVAARYGVAGKSHMSFPERVAMLRRVKGDIFADKVLKARAATVARAEKAGKTVPEPADVSALKALADVYGGFGMIDPADPDYRAYLDADVTASGELYHRLRAAVARQSVDSQRYLRREHRITAAMGRSITLEGFRTDDDEVMKRWSEGQQRLEVAKQALHEQHGMPLEGKKPHVTNPGKAAFRAAILATGISEQALDANWPLNKDGSLSTAKDTLNEMIEVFDTRNPVAAELCRTILAMNGERTVYGTLLDHMVGGRVHPYISPDQSSGRWSMKNPGLTVLGKRGGKARERAVLLADTDDEVLCAIDADQVDARVIAAECQDREYMKLFAPGMDLHSEVAFRVWLNMADHGGGCHRQSRSGHDCGVAAKCHCERRDQAKVFGHGFSYGLGAGGMARQHGVDLEVSLRFVAGMTEAFPRLAEWKGEVREMAGALGFDEPVPANDSFRILHTWAGRPVRVERARAYTQATALIGQGGTRDVMAEAILRLPAEYRRRIRAVIHDEIVLSLPKQGAQEVAQGIADGMAFDLRGVDITFGCSRVARTWAGCYGAEYETAA